MFRHYFYIFLFTVFACILAQPAHAASNIDVASTSQWHIRIDGAAANDRLSNFSVKLADVNENGKDDLVVVAANTDFNGRDNSGSIYIIYDTILDNYTGTGNTIDLSSSSSYNLRIDGPVASSNMSVISMGNLNNDSLSDMIISTYRADFNGRDNSGSVYVLYNSLLNVTGTGNTLDLSSSSAYSIRIDGASVSDQIGTNLLVGDLNANGIDDIVITAYYMSGNVGYVYIIRDNIFSGYTGTGNTMDLSSSSNYSIRYGGSGVNYFGLAAVPMMSDFDGDGLNDLVIGASYFDNNSRGDSGSVWVFFNTLLDDYTGTGNNLTITTNSTYNLRIDGSAAGQYLANSGVGDINNDGRSDLVLYEYGSTGPIYMISGMKLDDYAITTGNTLDLANSTSYTLKLTSGTDEWPSFQEAKDLTNDSYVDSVINSSSASNNSRANSGSIEFIPGTALTSYTSTGSTVTVNSVYSHRFDGAVADDYIPYMFASGDINGDGMKDYVFSSQESDYNSRSNSGSVWIVFNFPHTVTKSSADRNGNTITIKGSVAATQSTTAIAGAQYRIDNNSQSGSWTPCSADDGAFNSTSEQFTCVVGSIPTSSGNHNIYVRSYDSLINYTAQSQYLTHQYNDGSGNASTSFTPQIVVGGGGVASAAGDSHTDGQAVIAIIQEKTFNFNAFLSSVATQPINLPVYSGASPSIKQKTNTVLAGSILGVKTSRGVSWQIGNVQSIWYKAYGPGNTLNDAAKIIPELQTKPSIIGISYSDADLIPPGEPTKKFNPKNLKLAYSVDGITWKILPTSVVDTRNKTVAALHKLGGYYMIVSK